MAQYFHVIFKSYGGKYIFHCQEDYLTYLQMVARACKKYQVRWLAYALMSNHIHLVFCCESAVLRDVRYNISSGYAAYYRHTYPQYSAPGEPVFRPRNTTKWLQANNDLKQALRYVHRNLIEKGMETSLGDNPRTSYHLLLSSRMSVSLYDEFLEVRDALAADVVFRAFGKNREEQLQNFIAFHQFSGEYTPEPLRKTPTCDLKRAEEILQQFFSRRYTFASKTYTPKNRQVFLQWLGGRGNTMKVELVLQLSAETTLSSRQIAEFLHVGATTVKAIIRKHKK